MCIHYRELFVKQKGSLDLKGSYCWQQPKTILLWHRKAAPVLKRSCDPVCENPTKVVFW